MDIISLVSKGELRDVLANPTRQQILGKIRTNPGIHIRALCSELDLVVGVVQMHLEVLESNGLIRCKRFNHFKPILLFPSDYPEIYDELYLAMKNKNAYRMLQMLIVQQLNISELSIRLELHHSTIQYHLERLERLELVKSLKKDNFTRYTLNKTKLESFLKFLEINVD